jgi:hypothetical protein
VQGGNDPRHSLEVRFALDSPLEGGVTSELVSGIKAEGLTWHFFRDVGALSRKQYLGKWQKRWVFVILFPLRTRTRARGPKVATLPAGQTGWLTLG